MKNKLSILVVRYLSLAMSISMVAIVIQTSLASNLFEVLPVLNSQPWFTTTIIDFYFNIAVISIWVVYRENNIIKSMAWLVSFVVLGSISTCFYIFIQTFYLKPDDDITNLLTRKVLA